MRHLLLFFSIVSLLQISASNALAQVLQRVKVQFRTNDEDKDDDTKITYSLVVNNVAVAQLKDFAGDRKSKTFPYNAQKFKDNTDSPVYDIPVSAMIMRQQLKNAKSQIIIRPNGNDTWRFNVTVTLEYAGGQSEIKKFEKIQLKQDDPKGEVDGHCMGRVVCREGLRVAFV